MAGQVIGINSNKIGGSSVEGMGYAIPISAVRETIEEFMGRDTLIEVDEDDVGYIGIYMQEVTQEISDYYNIPVGVYVSEVIEDTGADDAGILTGDVITGINGNTVKSIDGLKKMMNYYAVGDTVDITFMRSEEGEYVEHTVAVTLGEKPEGVRTK
jgi:serine protease Do